MDNKYDFDSTWNAFFANCPGCKKPVEDGQKRHRGTIADWHHECWLKSDETDTGPVRPFSPPAFGDEEGMGWMDRG